jgi:hypothetical protein
MKKVRTEVCLGNSFDELFENENPAENQTLTFANNRELFKLEENSPNRAKSFSKILKQIFFFFPGTYLLYFASFIGAVVLSDIFIAQRPLDTFSSSTPFQIILLLLIGTLGTFMSWVGLGDIKNKKHSVIPVSIIVTGMAIGTVVKSFEHFSGLIDRTFDDFNYYFIYLLPLALIVPILAKGWVERKGKIFEGV